MYRPGDLDLCSLTLASHLYSKDFIFKHKTDAKVTTTAPLPPEKQTLAKRGIFFLGLFLLPRCQDALIVYQRQECWSTSFPSVADLFQRLGALFSTQDWVYMSEDLGTTVAGKARKLTPESRLLCFITPALLHSALPAAREFLHGREVAVVQSSQTVTAHKQKALIWLFNLTDRLLICSTSLNYPL